MSVPLADSWTKLAPAPGPTAAGQPSSADYPLSPAAAPCAYDQLVGAHRGAQPNDGKGRGANSYPRSTWDAAMVRKSPWVP
jgi:hypothetical protein